jgi:uncharacterized protein (DUF2336 family)
MRFMMSDQRVTQGEARGDAARMLHAAAIERLSVALTDLFLPARFRLSEWHRTTMAALLARLVRSVEDQLRGALAERFAEAEFPELHAALVVPHVEIALPILEPSSALRDSELVALLLRRAEEHRLHRAALRSAVAPDGLLGELVRDADAELAEMAMAVMIGHSRRLDAFQEPLIATTELPAELEHRLVWTVAAALRSYLISIHRIIPSDADRALAEAAARRLAAYDEGEGLEARCLMLARRLEALGRLGNDFIARSLAEGGLPLLLAALSLRCDLAGDAVWEVLSDPTERGAPLLLRAAGLSREEAGPILVALAPPTVGTEDELLVRQLDIFDTHSQDEARTTLRLWQVDPAYRSAIARVAASAGTAR